MVPSRGSMTTKTIDTCPFHGEIRGKFILFRVIQHIINFLVNPICTPLKISFMYRSKYVITGQP